MENVQRKLQSIIESVIVNNGNDYETGILLSAMGINSLKFIKIVIAIEEEFDIEFDDEYMSNEAFITLGDLMNYINLKTIRG